MQMQSLSSLIQSNIDLRHISAFCSERKKGEVGSATMEKPRQRSALVYVEGEMTLHSDGKKTICKTGDLLFFPHGSRYQIHCEEDTKQYGVNFILLDENGEEVLPFTVPTLLAHDMEETLIYEQFARCITLYRTSTNRIALKGEVFSLFSSVLVLYTTKNAPTGIQPAIDTIRNSIHDELRIADLASACGMSESTFRREFHRYAGVSPKQYILDRKLNKAKQMLRSGYYPIKEICMILGFFDDAYFSKIFKKNTGMTPMQYAEKAGKK
ncbi:MAG: AraC family transcriptional regulator [Clostridia bacterium]|nr:AraC family transcriptional regulator [Clostridia bacterium]